MNKTGLQSVYTLQAGDLVTICQGILVYLFPGVCIPHSVQQLIRQSTDAEWAFVGVAI